MFSWLTHRKWMLVVVGAILSLFLVAACGDDNGDDDGDGDGDAVEIEVGPLKIGVLVASTGGLSDFGPNLLNAANLAATEINEAGGVLGEPIEIVPGDTGTASDQGVTEANRLIDVEGVHAIVGALSSGVTLPIVESVTGPGNILQISPASTSVALIEVADNDFFFRTTISDLAQGGVLSTLAQDAGYGSVCTMHINNAYGGGLSGLFKTDFEAAGGTVPAEVPHEAAQPSYASELDTCVADGPDAIAALAYPESAGVFLREALERGDVENFLFVDGTKSGDMFEELGWPEALDGMKGTAPGFLEVTAGADFDAAFAAEYGETPALPFLRETYDAVYLIALAAQAAGSVNSTAMRDELRGVAGPDGEIVGPGVEGFTAALALLEAGDAINYEGAAGPVDFDDVGDVLVGAIETWHVDVAAQELVTDESFKVDLSTGDVTLIE